MMQSAEGIWSKQILRIRGTFAAYTLPFDVFLGTRLFTLFLRNNR